MAAHNLTRRAGSLQLAQPQIRRLKRSFHHENYALFVQFYKYLVVKNMAPTTINGYKHTVAEYIEFIRGEDVTNLSHLPLTPYPIPRTCVATYFPEDNVLIPIDSVADKSNTPTSKSVVVTVHPSSTRSRHP